MTTWFSARCRETGIDGKGLRQITFDEDETAMVNRYKHASYGNYFDLDPCYLPGGNIMFVSTRSRRAVSCHPSIVTSLHVMDVDGGNMRCLSGGQFTELAPRVLDDGRVIYMRWEYVDKGFGNAQSLWSLRPDGSHSDHVYKNKSVEPLLREPHRQGARQLPRRRLWQRQCSGRGAADLWLDGGQ